MLPTFLSSFLVISSLVQANTIEFSLGPHYSHYTLYQDEEDPQSNWNAGGEIVLLNFIPNIGLKLRASRLTYDMPMEFGEGTFIREYVPLTLCTSFNILPFLKQEWLRLSLETGFGLYLWQAWIYSSGSQDTHLQVPLVEPDEKVNERDIGFVGGITLQMRPFRNVAVEYATRYNYIFSSNLEKYGFYDKDEKIWENGVGVKFIMPL
ncbi:hypothetical protein AMJ74_00260 [candidate division WOR_3 bacterium SM1_77]|uniref:Outer membrane protein beta-barrel domain-containing protein n=1 Tax=candidate division WOR_3 bacterium SM1_77 TaxID=1703778 RepID=A0A0S8K1T1_UNCW3|nr:MAG: hypothetical protein AMJ74_00260 [candidate division WOR_3 bacterium SM1_77]